MSASHCPPRRHVNEAPPLLLQSEEKWKLLGDLALSQFEFGLAKECLYKARDFSGLLLLASAAGDAAMVERLAEEAGRSGDHNVAFTCLLLAGHTEQCLEVLISTGRLPEAAFFARTYLPSQVSRWAGLWAGSSLVWCAHVMDGVVCRCDGWCGVLV